MIESPPRYVFPTSPDHVWYQSFKKEGCGLLNDCAYNLSSITYKSSLVRALLDQEMLKVGGDGKNVYLAGFSEGAQMAGYMQLVDLPFALGGVVVMDGFPLPPLENMPGAPQSAARANASYFADDMKWIIYEGSEDYIFPPKLTLDTWGGIFSALGWVATRSLLAFRVPTGRPTWHASRSGSSRQACDADSPASVTSGPL